MSARVRWLILAFSVAGLGLAGASSWVHYKSLTDPSYVSPCDINESFNCTQLYLSTYGSVAGVPVALGGLIWFGLVALVAAFAQPDQKDGGASGYLRALSIIGLASIFYLAYVSLFVMKTACVLCMGTYACVVGIFALSMFTNGESMSRLPGRLGRDLGLLLQRPVALVAAIIYLVGAASLVAFFPKEGAIAEKAASAPAPAASAQASFEEQWSKQPRVDFGKLAEGAKVLIVKFNDYECPACAQAELVYKPIVEKFAKSNPGAVKYVIKDWPWNTRCNFNAGNTIPGHEGACDAAVAARIARDRGKYDEMAAWLYSHQPSSPEDIRAEVTKRLGVTDYDREYAQKIAAIRSDVADGGVLQISSTPTFFVNGVRLPSGMRPEYIELAINIELKRP